MKIRLDNFSKIQNLFGLLDLPGSDEGLRIEYETLMIVVDEKDHAVDQSDYNLAAQKRIQETAAITKIIELLRNKGVLQNNTLEIELAE